MLLTRRMERAGLKPLGFVANDYALCVWSLTDVGALLEKGRVASRIYSARICSATISRNGCKNWR